MPYRSVVDTIKRVAVEGSERHAKHLLQTASTSSSSTSPLSSPKGTPSFLTGILGRYGIFFSGVGPRVTWISIGGFVFFGAYEQAKHTILSMT